MNGDYQYDWRSYDALDDALVAECAALFSAHYGVWGPRSPQSGQRIKLSATAVRRFVPRDGWAVLARHHGELVGYALGIRTEVEDLGAVDWVTQLVVHTKHRHRGVASTLLFTFWGFSDHAAWGLVTSNPFAVRALERITWRRCTPAVIRDAEGVIREVGDQIHYVNSRSIAVDESRSVIDTAFFISHATLPDKLRAASAHVPWLLGEIAEGEEWLAFTFRSQAPMPLTAQDLATVLDRSDRTVRHAYERMTLDARHQWAQHHEHESSVAAAALALTPSSRVLDVGCGRGRHALELAARSREVVGVDFVEEFVAAARAAATERRLLNVRFVTGDARDVALGAETFDAAVCLYDVIGTFPEQADNQRVVASVARHLKPGGRLLASVMNMELTRFVASRRADVAREPQALQHLPPSNIMQRTGNVYDPRYFLLDEGAGVVYRKEQFDGDGRPPGEYVIRDRRYTRDDVAAMCEGAGLRLRWARPVALGAWDVERDATDLKAKEILFLAEKPT